MTCFAAIRPPGGRKRLATLQQTWPLGTFAVHCTRTLQAEVPRGRSGFDAGNKTWGACRVGNRSRKSAVTNL